MRRIILKLVNGISIAVIICAVVVLLIVVTTPKGEVPSLFGYSLFRVMTGSMEPQIPVDSLIIVKETEPELLQPGDVISFFSKDPALKGAVNTHRITEIYVEDGEYLFVTRGDANNVDDQYHTLQGDVIGKVVFSSTLFGKAVSLISNPLIFLVAILLPLVFLLAHSLYDSFNVARKLAKAEEEKAVREAIENIKKEKEDKRGMQNGRNT